MTDKQPEELHPIKPGTRPFEILHIDYVEPFVTCARKNQYVLVPNFKQIKTIFL